MIQIDENTKKPLINDKKDTKTTNEIEINQTMNELLVNNGLEISLKMDNNS